MAASVSVAGVRLAYDTAGAGDPPMTFVHGWACDRSYFAPQFRHFAAGHAVAAMDLRGRLCPAITVGQTVGAGHFNQLEVPGQVNAMIERFLAVNGLSTPGPVA
jgi:hypothetical protein